MADKIQSKLEQGIGQGQSEKVSQVGVGETFGG